MARPFNCFALPDTLLLSEVNYEQYAKINNRKSYSEDLNLSLLKLMMPNMEFLKWIKKIMLLKYFYLTKFIKSLMSLSIDIGKFVSGVHRNIPKCQNQKIM